jgi:Flp pilus assembly protein TadG
MIRFARVSALRRFARRQHGAVILETAIMLMVLLMFAFGIIDFGRVMYVSNAVTNATRDAGRWVAVQATVPATTAIQDKVLNTFNGYTFGGPAMVRANVAVTLPVCGGSPPANTITIITTYPFNWLTPLPRLLRWTTSSSPFTSNIHAKAIFQYEWCT